MFTLWFEQGGIMMWPLLVCSILFGAAVIERCWLLLFAGLVPGRRLRPAEMPRTRRIFEFFKEVPPAIGLLGTVLGVVESFGLENGRITAEAAGAGLGVACYTTIFGLVIAILATVAEYILCSMMPTGDMDTGKL